MNRLVLIDGNAILHRAFHALPPLTAPDGSMVNAVYGFTSMLFKLFSDLKPTHIAVAFDRPKPTFRKQLFAGYQAKRPKMDEELSTQITKVHDVIGAFGIPIYEVDGYEADDVIGSLAKQSPIQVIIVTGDRDLLQLVEGDHILTYMPVKGLSEAKIYGEKEAKERLGVAPKQIPDYKALAGDASDNYPGVSGIGPKTANQLLETFGSVENLYQAIQKKDVRLKEFSPAVIEKLAHGAEDAVLSKDLAMIRTDVPIHLTIEESKVRSLDRPQARKALENLHFFSLIKRLEKMNKTETPKQEKKKEEPQLSLV
ncbi:hypothetical protein HYV22_04010 [Candidatus Gottesmanbacteria bacterium]|nr:hypothetical protein [Candidatus Gottesmanbacteria bacterium]